MVEIITNYVAGIIADALAQAEEDKDANRIEVSTKADLSGIIVTTFVKDITPVWISFNKMQAAELILLLQSHVADCK